RWLDMLFAIAAVSNVVIGVVQEYTAKLKLDRIALLHQDGIHVRRNAEITQIEMTDAVLGDVVYLRAGDQVPADGLVLAAVSFDIDESFIKGETNQVYKITWDTTISWSCFVD